MVKGGSKGALRLRSTSNLAEVIRHGIDHGAAYNARARGRYHLALNELVERLTSIETGTSGDRVALDEAVEDIAELVHRYDGPELRLWMGSQDVIGSAASARANEIVHAAMAVAVSYARLRTPREDS